MNLFLVRLFGPGPSVERALDEESEMWALYHHRVSSHFPGLLFAYLSRMQALTLLKHRVSEFSHTLR